MATSLLNELARAAAQDFHSSPQGPEVFSPSFFLVIPVTAIASTPSVTPKLYVQDPTSQLWFKVWEAAAALTAEGTYAYYFSADGFAGDFDAEIIESSKIRFGEASRLTMTHGDADSMTYSATIVQATSKLF